MWAGGGPLCSDWRQYTVVKYEKVQRKHVRVSVALMNLVTLVVLAHRWRSGRHLRVNTPTLCLGRGPDTRIRLCRAQNFLNRHWIHVHFFKINQDSCLHASHPVGPPLCSLQRKF
jgi:hypothetical protein